MTLLVASVVVDFIQMLIMQYKFGQKSGGSGFHLSSIWLRLCMKLNNWLKLPALVWQILAAWENKAADIWSA